MSAEGIIADIVSFLQFAIRRFGEDRMSQAAGALTFTSLLGVVPLLVITFAVLAGFPAFDSFKEQVLETLMGGLPPEVGEEVSTYLADFTRSASNLTGAGVLALAVTAVLLLFNIEATLNRVWKVDRPRPIMVRLLIFWAILTVGPLLLGASFSLTTNSADILRTWTTDTLLPGAVTLASAVLRDTVALVAQFVTFTLLFMLVPARTVRFRDASIGGLFASIGFQVLRWGFDTFLTAESTYSTIYGAVAVIPIFFLWIYLSWTVIILGAVLSASFADWWKGRDSMDEQDLQAGETLVVAVAILAVLSRCAADRRTVEHSRLAEEVPLLVRDNVLEALKRAGYVVETMNGQLSLLSDLHLLSVEDLARDLGLGLGLEAPHGEFQSALNVILPSTGRLPEFLGQLRQAEAGILSQPLMSVLVDPLSHQSGDALIRDHRTLEGKVTRFGGPVGADTSDASSMASAKAHKGQTP